jgi:hypothetical protein
VLEDALDDRASGMVAMIFSSPSHFWAVFKVEFTDASCRGQIRQMN